MVTIFDAQFDNNDLSEWTGAYHEVGFIEDPVVSNLRPHHGFYHGLTTIPGIAAGERSYLYKILGAAYSEMWCRSYYVILDSLPAVGKAYNLFSLCNSTIGDDTIDWIQGLQVANVAGNVIWRLMSWQGAEVQYAAAVGPQLSTWYMIQHYLLVGGALTGRSIVYIAEGDDPVSVTINSGLITNNARGDADLIRCGQCWNNSLTPHRIIWDCVKADDTAYIDPEIIAEIFKKVPHSGL